MGKVFRPAALRGRLFFVSAVFALRIAASAAAMPDAARPSSPPSSLGPIKAVVLDMDGVTTPNSGALWTQLGQEFLRGVAPRWAEGDLRHIKWKSLPDVHGWIVQNRGAQLSYADYVHRREALAAFIYGELAELEPTFLETWDVLKARGVPMALASANTRFSVDSMLRRFHLERKFDAAASSDELAPDEARHGKSQTHLLACRRLGAPPHQSLAVEDTSAGIEAAKKAGMIAVGFRNGFNDHEDFSSAHLVIRRLREIHVLFGGTL